MRKYHKILTNTLENMTQGNHKVVWSQSIGGKTYYTDNDKKPFINGITRVFIYHASIIAYFNDNTGEAFFTHDDYYTTSTTQAINGYKEYAQKHHYTLIDLD